MAVQGGEDVYATLLLTDSYLPGALVLAHSLRDAGTSRKLAVLVTLDTVSAEVITQLKHVYDYVLPVNRVRNVRPANLYLMDRPDLHSAFTKINLWRQTQFRRIVYLDADVVAYRAPDELFDLPHRFSAAPDIGWPDLFNTGVMVLSPGMGDYYAMLAMAERGISFDGADQGLLNMHFKNNYNRLSFTYNVTPSGHYQYVPAYRHFQSSINMVHFIGTEKPWRQGRDVSLGSSPFDEMVGRWWAVYDRHYRNETTKPLVSTTTDQPPQSAPEFVQYFVKGEFQPTISYVVPVGEPSQEQAGAKHDQDKGHQQGQVAGESQPEQKSEPKPIQMHIWDAQRHPPPADSQPEAANFPHTQYQMSSDPAPFVPPKRYPSPPRNMWYEVPKERPTATAQKPKAIFPWENHQARATRVFANEPPEPEQEPVATGALTIDPSGSSLASMRSEPDTPIITVTSADPWSSFTRTNAWDEVPEIERYVETMQPKHRRAKSQGLKLGALPQPPSFDNVDDDEDESTRQRRGSKVTDFPSAADRPSLPVTPAPIRRPKFWGGGGPGMDDDDEDESMLPAAEGVPAQSAWDPVAQLQLLAKQQSELLLAKLGGPGPMSGSDETAGPQVREIPNRSLPFGSEGAMQSPTYVAQSSPSTSVLSPQPLKPSSRSNSVRNLLQTGIESADTVPRNQSTIVPEPSYHGPSVAFEKGEEIPSHGVRAALPTDDERDVLET